MDEQRPYEKGEPPFSQLPDIDRAWADMKARLDEDDKRRRFVLPPFFAGCGLLMLLLLAGGGLWWYFSSGEAGEEIKQNGISTTPVAQKNTPLKKDSIIQVDVHMNKLDTAQTPPASKGKRNILTTATKPTAPVNVNHNKTVDKVTVRNRANQVKNTTSGNRQKGPKGKTNVLLQKENESFDKLQQSEERDSIFTATPPNRITAINDKATQSAATTEKNTTTVIDTITHATDTGLVQKTADTVAAPQVKPKRENKSFRLAAGLTLQQQLPLAGQQWTPYNYRGRRGSLADYVPAIDVRLYKQKWFVQAGFRYGAPQYTREFVYSKDYKRDTFGTVQSSTAYSLKKTYYHQVPVSFNYFIKPNWSVGAGVVYNRFFGAVSEREDRAQLTPTTDSLIGKAIVRDRNDSLFRSSNVQLLFETQYQWKRLAIGARLAQGLQPFIHYTDAQGIPQKQRSGSVNLFVRYELWRQKN